LFSSSSITREETLAGPIRGELLGAEHLAERAREVARRQRARARGRGKRKTPLLERLNETRGILDDAHSRLAKGVEREINIGPAGEWFLDNYHVVLEHIREVRESLPRSYYRELPELISGPLAGYPRVYQLAITLISHTEGRIHLENVGRFFRAAQEVTTLNIGELWAVPAMVRLGLIENIRRMALRTVQRLAEIELADTWVTRIQEASESGSDSLNRVLRDFLSDRPQLTIAFVSRFLHQVRQAAVPASSLTLLEHWISEEGLNAEEASSQSTQRLALTQITMANSITSLLAMARMDWRVFVEDQSVMEAVLREDPSGFYPRMTFATRDHYRHSVERIAKQTRIPEETVARSAIDLAETARLDPAADPRGGHVGYYLVGGGLPELEQTTGYWPSPGESLHRWAIRHPNIVFVGGILGSTVVALATLLWLAGSAGRSTLPLALLFGFLPAMDIGVRFVNQLVTALLPPRTLPKLDLGEQGVPAEFRTAVVIPTLFDNVETVHRTLENLEAQFLANRESQLHFAVLGDFTDSTTEHRETDSAIIAAAVAGVRALNVRYGEGVAGQFYLFHRPRRWNPQQGVWMGWERKRGKLAEFNRFLRGHGREAFSVIEGNVEPLREVRYVITLDADTVLPPEAAPLLIGALAHPLNRAAYDPSLGRVVRGYGILQPRVGVALPSANRSWFAAIHSGHPGVDPYTTAVSDVYQDLYGEGSYTGKGIYEVDAFERATHGRFPENTLLSHDLIEGNYARAGLATDITVYDDYPRTYHSYTSRKHRWIRGDWQLLPWLGFRVPGPDGPEPNRLSLLSRWKILDNMRRSTVEISQLALLVAAWTVLPGSPWRWTWLALGAVAAPWIVALLLAALRPPLDKSWRAYYGAVGRDAVTSAQQLGLALVFLPHQAWVSADAILRTLWRLLVTKRCLLEWETASQIEQGTTQHIRAAWRSLWPAIVVGGGLAGLAIVLEILRHHPGDHREWQLTAAIVPFLALWLSSAAVARALNLPPLQRERRLSAFHRTAALRYALFHWRYFEYFTTPETQWLVPDNYQEDPQGVVAMRTSPTNLGLQLLATVSAYDLGFITLETMTRRLEQAFRSFERMRRFRGHFYNWYSLRDLSVLEPGYISTVDSGNLAGHLLALRQACLALPDEPVFDTRVWSALETGVRVAEEHLGLVSDSAEQAVVAAQAQLRSIRIALTEASPITPPLGHLAFLAAALDEVGKTLHQARGGSEDLAAVTKWIDWSRDLIAQHQATIAELSPRVVGGRDHEAAFAFPTQRELEQDTGSPGIVARLEALANRADAYVREMDFRFLYDPDRKLFAIGYQESTHSLDNSYFDLLASEARLASFVAIAKKDVPVDHWFRLGRTLTRAAGETALVSWSGSMFEYLMPPLVMRSFPFTVLDQTYQGVVQRQIAYGAERAVPWGISESAYNVRDRYQVYQYRAFGVPDLALKRGLGRDLVIAPYATGLAAMIDPPQALANLAALERRGALGPFGFRDALDYTRPVPGRRWSVVAAYMAHHNGMTLVALTNVLAARLWQRRFHADPLVRSAELLLHERIPRRLQLLPVQTARAEEALPDPDLERPAVREINTPDTVRPHIALLGQLPYTIMVSHAGAGYSRYEDLAVTRWRADGTRDNTGQFCYLKDLTDGRVWSAAHQPVCAPADRYRALLGTDQVALDRLDGSIETRTEITVVPADAAEVRRISVTNNGDEAREIELTSYGEIVLAPPDSDRAHAAFSNLFVETEWHEWCTAITATRRPRSAQERTLWLVHVVDGGKARVGPVTCETDRARFVGRGRSTRTPVAMETDGALSGTTGAVLDPVFALRTRVRVEPRQSVSVAFTTLVATSMARALELAGRYHEPHAAQRALDLAWTTTQVELRELAISPADAGVFQEIAGHLQDGHPALRAEQEELMRNRGSQAQLWSQGISGDCPILLAMIASPEGLPTLRQLFNAHRYWRRRGMLVDLVILNQHQQSYQQPLDEKITEALLGSADSGLEERPGGVFIRRQDALRPQELLMLRATAQVHILCDGRPLGRIVDSMLRQEENNDGEHGDTQDGMTLLPLRSLPGIATATAAGRAIWRTLAEMPERESPKPPARAHRISPPGQPRAAGGPDLQFDNGFGGLTADGSYLVRVRSDLVPPAPWINVIANPYGGFLISERGAGCSWAGSSYFYRLTPWSNDPVSDPPGEAIYIQDVESDELWCPTPAPVPSDASYTVQHRPGVTTFEQESGGIATHLALGLAEDAMVKLSVLRITNRGKRPRQLRLTSYVEWTLGFLRERTRHQVRTEFEAGTETIFAQNFFDPQFADWVAFSAMTERVSGFTADRGEFLGRNGSLADPAALDAAALLGTTGAGIDPCAALQCLVRLAPGETREIGFLLGAAAGRAQAQGLLSRYRKIDRVTSEAARTIEAWEQRLSVVQVRTPDPSFDAMVNRWTLYQALACRMWGRTALYQSSGAYGFRDQLQDSMAFLYAEPALARAHILRAASRQFVEGDVQHWWHPETGRGMRTRFSDDLAWLPFVVDQYIKVTGDSALLDEEVPYLTARPLEAGELEVYDSPAVAGEKGSVYDHCLRALRKASTTGDHGLPLIGIGDWNDGMNRVGVEGKGESIWLGWFLATTLEAFVPYAKSRGDAASATEFRRQAKAYVAAIEAEGWDGEWYRRAYFDDGTPLGSAQNEECRIDSIAQSWSVISGAARPERQVQAMKSLEEHLVDPAARLIRLLTPAFDKTSRDPGYIKGYVPGVRENGAQYTHAALWTVLAAALQGDGDRAFTLYQMINPLTHAGTAADVLVYKVEPYVVAADVYTAPGHVGRGGWTWYTGSASWMYRIGLEGILGFTKRGDSLELHPCVPAAWPEYRIDYRFGRSTYSITVQQPGKLQADRSEVILDGIALDGTAIPLQDDGKSHEVLVRPSMVPSHSKRQQLRLGF
jgi:cellobiose phosphorylase